MKYKELLNEVEYHYGTLSNDKKIALLPRTVEDKDLLNEIKEWIDALESGQYEQASETLHEDTVFGGYCCLGVACSLAGISDDDLHCGQPNELEVDPVNKLTEWLMNPSKSRLDLYTSKFERILIGLNDETEAGFDFIAKVLKAKYKIYE